MAPAGAGTLGVELPGGVHISRDVRVGLGPGDETERKGGFTGETAEWAKGRAGLAGQAIAVLARRHPGSRRRVTDAPVTPAR